MAGKVQGYQDILTSLFIEEDVPKAIRLTVARHEHAYSYYKFVRQKIFANDLFRHPQYLQRLRHFQHVHFSPQDVEWKLLEDLYHSPLREQYRVETSNKAYLTTTPELDKALKQIRSIADPFYDYTLPDAIIEDAIERERRTRELKHSKAVTIRDLQVILCKAQGWRERKENPWELVSCALFLCGRRVIEIISTLEWEKAGSHLARVTGIAKQDMDSDPFVIPLLCPYEDFDELMTLIRVAQLPLNSHTHRLKPAFIRWFGEWYNHSQRRNIYAEAAFRLRREYGLFPDMSKVMWLDKVLCHSSNVVQQAPNLVYQSLLFEDE